MMLQEDEKRSSPSSAGLGEKLSRRSSADFSQPRTRPPNPRELTQRLRRSASHREQDARPGEEPVRKDSIYGLGGDEEHAPPITENAIATTQWSWPSSGRWRTYFFEEVAGDKYLEFQLLLMTLTTGCLDTMTYTTYSVFCSKQTGNTMLLALYSFSGTSRADGIEKNVGMSIGIFIIGAAFFGQLGHITRQRLRIWLLVSNLSQALLVLGAAAVRYWTLRQAERSALAIIALLAFVESGQIATALNVNMPELNTTMITGALIMLCTDRHFFALHNPKRNRRLAFFISMLLGNYVGSAAMDKYSPSLVLVIVAALKGLLVVTFFFNRGVVPRTVTLEGGGRRTDGAVTPVTRMLWGD